MKSFEKPFCEVVLFRNDVIAASCTANYCHCYDGIIEYGEGANDCAADVGFCTCIINHVAGTLNCTPCTENEED